MFSELAALVAGALKESVHEEQIEWTGKVWLGNWLGTNRSENTDALLQAVGKLLTLF